MKTEFTDISDCRKQVAVEIPTATVDQAIDRLSKRYGRAAKVPGFRPGRVPARLVRTRFREQILHDVAQDLIPKAVDAALESRGVAPVATPEIRDVDVDEGKPLTFTATFETVPPIDPGNYDGFTLRQTPVTVDADAVDKALARLRDQAARLEPVERRLVEPGDVVTLNLERRLVRQPASAEPPPSEPERHRDAKVEIGNDANPPGFDEALIGLEVGATRAFTVTFPDTHEVEPLRGAEAAYEVELTAIQRRVVPELDDAFARGVGEFESLAALRSRVEADLTAQAEDEAKTDVRNDLLRQLANRVSVEVPDALIRHEVERRVEQLARHMLGQRIDPRRANIDWDAFRQQQRAAATDTVRSTLVIDEIATREVIEVTPAEVTAELERQAALSGRTASAVRALVEKEGGVERLKTGLRREKAIDFLLARATIVAA